MADTRTRPGTDRRPLISYLRVQRDLDRQMIAILRRSSERISRELAHLATKPGIGAAVRREQLLLTQAAIHRELTTLWDGIGRTVMAGRETAAAAAVEGIVDRELLRSVLPAADADYLLDSMRTSARSTVEVVQARLELSQIPLAESVYKNRELSNGKIDAIVNEALARGASARELAADVRRFIRPDVQGGVRYAAFRLGRTELNNAFHATQVQTGIKTPWITGLKWNLSGSHPRPDECNEYADADNGMGAGVWEPEQVPAKPHPNCLCFTTSETVGRDQFVDSFMAGDYDGFVDEIMRNGGMTFR